MPSRRLVLFGPPGVGKGTQAVRLREELCVAHISTGDILRDNVKRSTDLGVQAKGFMDAGKLVPDDLVIALVEDRLKADDCKEGFILDGFPRTAEQYDKLDSMLEARGTPVEAVLYFSAPDETLVRRIAGRRMCRDCGATYHVDYSPCKTGDTCEKCGGEVYQRADDNEATVAKRLQEYQAMSAPLLSRYQETGLLAEIDGTLSQEEVFQAALVAIS
ncbi:MAG: adenylate kinase [Planctomycetes bacterium]|nr:adenylate kinase [Planctomycetota bacterium]